MRRFRLASLILCGSVVARAMFAPAPPPAFADSGLCATPGRDGPGGVLSGIVNTYYPGAATVAAGSTSIPVGTPLGAATPISAGDLLLVIQMQDAEIDSTNTDAYGDGVPGDPATGWTALNNAGRYEYVIATGPVAAGSVPILGAGAGGGLVYTYTNADATATHGQRRYQVVRVPQYSSATLSSGLTALRWNGRVGGILALDVAGTLTLGGTVSVNGLGFRGGGGRQAVGSPGLSNTDYRTPSWLLPNGSKGEGIAGTPRLVYDGTSVVDTGVEGYPAGAMARGAPGNAGGGGTDGLPLFNSHNSGGGGGGNGGTGGRGGYTWSSILDRGGHGGLGFGVAAAPIRLVMGGGGGAGTRNNTPAPPNHPAAASGGPGGGIVMIRAGTVVGSGGITADGGVGVVPLNDGSGGGGAGGSVLLLAQTWNPTSLTVSAAGGAGANNWITAPPGTPGEFTPGPANNRHGPGGGGGGGVVFLSSGANTTTAVTGGANGTTTTAGSAFGALPGSAGIVRTNVTPAELPTAIAGAPCLPILTTEKTTSTPSVINGPAGTTAVYTISVSNAAGRGTAINLRISDALPSGFTYASTTSVVLSGGASRSPVTDPSPGDTNPVWGVFTLPGGGSITITFTVNIASTVPDGTYQNPATATYSDPVRTVPAGTASAVYDPGSSANEDVTVSSPPNVIAKSDVLLIDDGDGQAEPGETLQYAIVITNNGWQDALEVVYSDPPDPNTSLVVGSVTTTQGTITSGNSPGDTSVGVSIGTLAARGGSVTITFRVTINNPLPAGVVEVANQGTVSGTNFPATLTDDPDTVPVGDPTRTPVEAAPDLAILKSDGGAIAVPGATVTYTLTYRNVGNQGATGVALTDIVPAHTTFNPAASTPGWSCAPNNNAGSTCTLTVGSLAGGGASGTANFAVTVVNPLPPAVDRITNTATIADDGANGPDPNPANNSDTDTTPVEAAPDLAILKSDGGAIAVPGATVTYTLTYRNVGNQGATGVALSDIVPAHTTFNPAASTPGWSCAPDNNAGSTCTLTIGSLAGGGASGTANFAVTVVNPLPPAVDRITNTATIADDGANGPDPNPANNSDTDTTPVEAAPDLAILKSDGGASTVPGATVTYTLTYRNVGNQGATGVALTDVVPAHTTFNPAASTPGWSCAPDNNAGSTCTLTIGSLAGGGASGTANFAVTVVNPLPPAVDRITNTATIADDGANGPDPNPENNRDTDTTPVEAAPDLAILKSDGGASTVPGATVTYTLTYRNVGNQGATGVALTDTVPAHTTFNPAASTPGWSCAPDNNAGSTCTLTVGSLAGGGASGTANFAVTVVNPLPPAVSLITNTATIADDDANGPDQNPADNSDTDTTPVLQPGDLAKSIVTTSQAHTSGLSVAIGEIATYRVRLNIPPGTMADMTLTDTLEQGLAFVECVAISASAGISTSLPGGFDDACNAPTNPTVSAAPPGSPDVIDQGRRVVFDLGDVTNASGTTGIVQIDYRAVVLDALPVVRGVRLLNAVLWEWEGGEISGRGPAVTAVEPSLTLAKTASPTVALPGSSVLFTLSLAHQAASDSDAFDLVLRDLVPAGLTYQPGSLAWTGIGVPPTALDDSSPTVLTARWDAFPLGATSQIRFRAVLGALSPGQQVINLASLEWTSLPEDDVQAPFSLSPFNALSTERFYDPGSEVNIYQVSATASVTVPQLPPTGFAPGRITRLPPAPQAAPYTRLGEIWLRIPRLGVQAPVVGVPANETGWDVTWLWNQVGYLEGTAFPTLSGNTGLTAHVYLPDGTPGPFVNLKDLRWGDRIHLEVNGLRYVYEVRQVTLVRPHDLSPLRHEDLDWLTLITCQGYDPGRDAYRWRLAVRAVRIAIDG